MLSLESTMAPKVDLLALNESGPNGAVVDIMARSGESRATSRCVAHRKQDSNLRYVTPQIALTR